MTGKGEGSVPLTQWLSRWRDGDGKAFAAVIEATYDELRQMAAQRIARAPDARGSPTFSSCDLLNEAVARVLKSQPDLGNRAHYFAVVSLTMRAILVDHARARSADKRGGGLRVTLTDGAAIEADAFDLLALDQALARLAAIDARGSEILHLKYFAGLQQDEIAAVLRVSTKTVERDLRFARAWLQEVLSGAR